VCLSSRKNVKHSGFDPRRHLVLAEAADKSRAQIADDVAIEIRQHHHIQPVRIQDRLQAGVVHDRFAVSDFRKLFGGGAAATANARFTASAISGPIPSPAINVAVCTIPRCSPKLRPESKRLTASRTTAYAGVVFIGGLTHG
jgi:hypothetical protein